MALTQRQFAMFESALIPDESDSGYVDLKDAAAMGRALGGTSG